MTEEKLIKLKMKLKEFGLTEYGEKYFFLQNWVTIETLRRFNETIDEWEAVKKCFLLIDEIFPGDDLPCDEAFKNLVLLKRSLETNSITKQYGCTYAPEFIRALVEYPHSQIIDSIEALTEYTGCTESEVMKHFGKNASLFFRTKEEIGSIILYVTEQFGEEICRVVFWDALALGNEKVCEVISCFRECTGTYADEVIRKMYMPRKFDTDNKRKAYLLTGNSVTDAMRYLYCAVRSGLNEPDRVLVEEKKNEEQWHPLPDYRFRRSRNFDHETNAFILSTFPEYLSRYKPIYEWDVRYGDNIDSAPDDCYEICDLVRAYEIQLETSCGLCSLRYRVKAGDANILWYKDFVPLFDKVRDMNLEYPFCPKLIRELICTVTAFFENGFAVPKEYERYMAESTTAYEKTMVETNTEYALINEETETITCGKDEIGNIWTQVKNKLQISLQENVYKLYFEKLNPIEIQKDMIVLSSDSETIIKIIENKFSDLVRKELLNVTGKNMDFCLILQNKTE